MIKNLLALFSPNKSQLRKYWIMIWEMAVSEFKMKDQGTFLGFLWTLLHPLVYFLVLYNLFVNWMGARIPEFPLYLIIGIVQWNFFSAGTLNSISSVMRNGSYIKAINFPKSILVISSVLSALFPHLLELLILIVFWIIVKGHVGLAVVGLVPLLALNIFLVLSLSFILATVGVYFLDINRIWGIFMNVGLFLTPIFYSLDMLSPGKRMVINLNPMTHIIKASRDILIDNRMPEGVGLLYVCLLSGVLLAAGYSLFKKQEGYFVEKI
ncbi:MAG: ABC transporter permease [Endomicrobiales bacterium]